MPRASARRRARPGRRRGGTRCRRGPRAGRAGSRRAPRRSRGALGREREDRADLVDDLERRVPRDAAGQLVDVEARRARSPRRRPRRRRPRGRRAAHDLEVPVGDEVAAGRRAGPGGGRGGDLLGAEHLQPVPRRGGGRPGHDGGDADDGEDGAAQGQPPARRRRPRRGAPDRAAPVARLADSRRQAASTSGAARGARARRRRARRRAGGGQPGEAVGAAGDVRAVGVGDPGGLVEQAAEGALSRMTHGGSAPREGRTRRGGRWCRRSRGTGRAPRRPRRS